jgi:hypothetical protein
MHMTQVAQDVERGAMSNRKTEGRRQLKLIRTALARGETVVIADSPDARNASILTRDSDADVRSGT